MFFVEGDKICVYRDRLVVQVMFSEELFRHPLKTFAAGLYAEFIFGVIPVNKVFFLQSCLCFFSILTDNLDHLHILPSSKPAVGL